MLVAVVGLLLAVELPLAVLFRFAFRGLTFHFIMFITNHRLLLSLTDTNSLV